MIKKILKIPDNKIFSKEMVSGFLKKYADLDPDQDPGCNEHVDPDPHLIKWQTQNFKNISVLEER